MKTLFVFFAAALLTSYSGFGAKDKYALYEDILKINDDSVKCARLILLAEKVADSLYDYSFSLMTFEKANSILSKHRYPVLELDLYYKWGFVNYHKGNYDRADKLYLKALESKVLDSKQNLKANILNMAAVNLQELTVFKRALEYYNEALEIYTRLKDDNAKAAVYVNMANIFALSGNLKESDAFFDRAGKIFIKLDKMERYATLLGNKSYIKWKLGYPDSGKVLLIRSFEIASKYPGNMTGKIEHLFNLGIMYGELRNWDSCFYFLERGKKISDSLSLFGSLDGSYYYSLGYCHQLKGDLKEGIRNYKKAINLKTGISNFRLLHDNISALYFRLKQFDSALIYKNISFSIADSIYKSELQEHINFEDKRIELIEKDYENRIRSAEQEQHLENLKKRNYLLIVAVILLIAFVLLFILYFRQYKLKEKKEHLESELNFLKAQMNPHFLFNSINNIYVLLDENKEKASEILLKFSDLLRYQLYECNVSFISLNKELNFLENFIEFEKLRYSNKIQVIYEFENPPSADLMIAPLLLQPFIENAFKHTPKTKNHQASIRIKTYFSGDNFTLEVINSVDGKKPSSLPGGIGLENVKRRLRLLYNNKHQLRISTEESTFTTTLSIKLTK
ncbi:MAG: sensor histidine kinase [Bacteroidetes bacterium]|nr:sensor histidine kinase [Bacteroidota bacterium]